jgi:hypothetical protein
MADVSVKKVYPSKGALMSNEIENFEMESMETYAEFLRILQQGLMVHNKLVDAAFTLSFSSAQQSQQYILAFRHFIDGVTSMVQGLEYFAESQTNE